MSRVVEMICGDCAGRRKEHLSDGVGGKWHAKCRQCKGAGKVRVLK